jgi:hypothetical protein
LCCVLSTEAWVFWDILLIHYFLPPYHSICAVGGLPWDLRFAFWVAKRMPPAQWKELYGFIRSNGRRWGLAPKYEKNSWKGRHFLSGTAHERKSLPEKRLAVDRGIKLCHNYSTKTMDTL